MLRLLVTAGVDLLGFSLAGVTSHEWRPV